MTSAAVDAPKVVPGGTMTSDQLSSVIRDLEYRGQKLLDAAVALRVVYSDVFYTEAIPSGGGDVPPAKALPAKSDERPAERTRESPAARARDLVGTPKHGTRAKSNSGAERDEAGKVSNRWRRVSEYLTAHTEGSVEQMAEALGDNRKNLGVSLAGYMLRGLVERIRWGVYVLAESPAAAAPPPVPPSHRPPTNTLADREQRAAAGERIIDRAVVALTTAGKPLSSEEIGGLIDADAASIDATLGIFVRRGELVKRVAPRTYALRDWTAPTPIAKTPTPLRTHDTRETAVATVAPQLPPARPHQGRARETVDWTPKHNLGLHMPSKTATGYKCGRCGQATSKRDGQGLPVFVGPCEMAA